MSLFVSTLCGKQIPMNFTGAFRFYSERNEGDAVNFSQFLCVHEGEKDASVGENLRLRLSKIIFCLTKLTSHCPQVTC